MNKIKGQIELKKLRPEHVTELVEIANDFYVWKNLRNAFPHPYTVEDADRFVKSPDDQGGPFRRGIFFNDQLVGNIGLHPQDDVYAHSAELGYFIGQPYWGRGFGTEAVGQMVNLGFEKWGIERIYAGVYDYNQASIRILEKCGFAYEGTLKRAVFKNGQYHDEVRFAVLNSSFTDNKNR